MTPEQEKFIEENLGKMLNKQIADKIGVTAWTLSMYLNKRRKYKQREKKYFVVELPNEYSWIV